MGRGKGCGVGRDVGPGSGTGRVVGVGLGIDRFVGAGIGAGRLVGITAGPRSICACAMTISGSRIIEVEINNLVINLLYMERPLQILAMENNHSMSNAA